MENFLKCLLFLEVMTLITTAIMHLILYVSGKEVLLYIYPIMMGIVFICCLLVVFVFAPLHEFIQNL